ncbi:hypothetical protein [Eubacterium sp.]|uniref:hypothetical protein n=1 Tax=Eubacterium sp. TaxID=142586 RepID=UPI001EB579AA|nr:hypothetical protein [Eubacterium sp.]MBS5274699.1 hypothetical protein [Clostridiales bacterium]
MQLVAATATTAAIVVKSAAEQKDDDENNYPRGITASAIIATHYVTSLRAFYFIL